LAFFSAFSAVFSSTGCTRRTGGETPSEVPGTPPPPLEHAYTETVLPARVDGASFYDYAAGKVYFDDQISSPGSPRLISVSPDSPEETTLWSRESPEPYSELFTGYSVTGFAACEDGGAFVVSRYVYPDPDNVNLASVKDELVRVSPDGAELYAFDLSELPDGAPSMIYGIETDSADNIYLLDLGKQCIYAFDGASGAWKFTASENIYIDSITRANDGNIVYMTADYVASPDNPERFVPAYTMKTLDFASGKVSGESSAAPGELTFYGVFAGAGEHSFYSQQGSTKLFGFDDTMTPETVIDFVHSDIDISYLYMFAAAENGEFLAVKRDGGGIKRSLVRLVPNPDATLGGKALLRLSTPYLDEVTHNAVLEFNRTSKLARIEITEFSNDITKFDLDIMSKDPPDLFSFATGSGLNFDSGGVASGLNIVKYISKGVFADLYPYLDADDGISRDDLFSNILDATATGEKLYLITPFFSIATLAGKQSIFGDTGSITPEELEAIADKYPDAAIYDELFRFYDGQEAWMRKMLRSLSRFVDLSTGETRFDSPEFIAQLKLSERMPPMRDFTDIDYTEYAEHGYAQLRRDNEVLLEAVALTSPRDARTLETDLFGEPVALVGYPTYGENGGVISPVAEYAVSSASKNPEAAWSFIASTLAEDFEPKFRSGTVQIMSRNVKEECFALNKNVFERRAAEEMKPLTERAVENLTLSEFKVMLATYPAQSLDDFDMTLPKFQSYALTETDIARVRAAIEGATTLSSGDSTVENIVNEELGAFYAKVKTAEETARLIQSRVALYVSESS
jgi:hypothetical protein